MRATPPIITILALLPLCAGCGPDVFSYGLPTNPNLPAYHAYGDSVTAGLELQTPALQAYPALLAISNQFYLSNNSFSGDQACDVPIRQIFGHQDSPSLAHSWLSTLLIGANDLLTKGIGPYEAVFNLCHQAAIAWLGLPVENKVLATATSVITSGAGHLEIANNWNARTTDAQNASVTFPFQLPAAGAVYVWYRIIDGNQGTFTYALDGKLLGSETTQTVQPIQTYKGNTDSLALLRLPSVSAGAHSLTFTQTSNGLSGMGIVAIGMPPAANNAAFPRVLVGTIPPEFPTYFGGCGSPLAPCAEYTADITANVAMFAGDHLNVQIFTSGKYMSDTTADMNDPLHPNYIGHMEIAHAVQDVLQ